MAKEVRAASKTCGTDSNLSEERHKTRGHFVTQVHEPGPVVLGMHVVPVAVHHARSTRNLVKFLALVGHDSREHVLAEDSTAARHDNPLRHIAELT